MISHFSFVLYTAGPFSSAWVQTEAFPCYLIKIRRQIMSACGQRDAKHENKAQTKLVFSTGRRMEGDFKYLAYISAFINRSNQETRCCQSKEKKFFVMYSRSRSKIGNKNKINLSIQKLKWISAK